MLWQVDIPLDVDIGPFVFHVTGQGVRCVPLISSISASTTSGALAILGQPFFRAHAVRFDRAHRQLSVAPLPPNVGTLCDACPATGSAAAGEGARADAADTHALLPPGSDLAEGSARFLRFGEVRWPRWAVSPELRHGAGPAANLSNLSSTPAAGAYPQWRRRVGDASPGSAHMSAWELVL